MAVKALNVGLVADASMQLADLESLIQRSGHKVAVAFLATSSQLDHLSDETDAGLVDAWVVRLDLQADLGQLFVEKLDSLAVPVIYDDLENPINMDQDERVRRFSSKINMCIGAGVSSTLDGSRAREVWVLVASTGGVEAVAEFLRALPKSIPGVAFLYVQHIDANISESLKKAVVKNTQWRVFSAENSHMLCEGCIYIVSPDNQFDLSSTGVLTPVGEDWVGPFKPSADQVIAKVARIYGKSSGAIVFSGMGDDGAKSCYYMKHSGGEIWTQSAETCAVDSMPLSAEATGCVSYSAAATQLAVQFSQRLNQTISTGNRSL